MKSAWLSQITNYVSWGRCNHISTYVTVNSPVSHKDKQLIEYLLGAGYEMHITPIRAAG